MARRRISATVITGFLGVGKTTLIRNLIARVAAVHDGSGSDSGSGGGMRLALIVNEFGDVGVDGSVLASCSDGGCAEDDIIELANGCICCTVADDFVPVMERLLGQDAPPDHILIETSGLALPQPLVQAFHWPGIRGRVVLDGVITVVDGLALSRGGVVLDGAAVEAQRRADAELDHATPLEDLFKDQLSAANIVLISKGDLLDDAGRRRVEGRLKAMLGERTPLVWGSLAVPFGGDASLDVLLGLGLEAEAFARSAEHHHHHDHDHDHEHEHDHDHDHDHGHDAFKSVVVSVPEIVDHAAFIARLEEAVGVHGLLRAKGFLRVRGKAVPLVVQAVGNRVEHYFGGRFANNEGADNEGRLVLIGFRETDFAALSASLSASLMAGSFMAGSGMAGVVTA